MLFNNYTLIFNIKIVNVFLENRQLNIEIIKYK